MAISIKKKSNKSLYKSKKNYNSKKHLNKSRKCRNKTRKMSGGQKELGGDSGSFSKQKSISGRKGGKGPVLTQKMQESMLLSLPGLPGLPKNPVVSIDKNSHLVKSGSIKLTTVPVSLPQNQPKVTINPVDTKTLIARRNEIADQLRYGEEMLKNVRYKEMTENRRNQEKNSLYKAIQQPVYRRKHAVYFDFTALYRLQRNYF